MRTVLFLMSAVLLLSACGMKGPLYLPPQEPAAHSPPTSATPAAGAASDAKKDQAAGQTGQ
jgi:predicted small lipoprotein YifL